jgi:hypothetical protein
MSMWQTIEACPETPALPARVQAGVVEGPGIPSVLDFVNEGHFEAIADPVRARRLFAHSVRMVEIETFSFCNRRCWFCPNATIDRHSVTHYMPAEMYASVIGQLQALGFAGQISFSRYNEPLADRVILDRLQLAHRLLPATTLHTNTNGDYLTAPYMRELHAAGLRSLNIQIYLANEDRYDHERMRHRLAQLTRRLALDLPVIRDEPDVWLEAAGHFDAMAVRVYARNFDRNGCDRGGTVAVSNVGSRLAPCLSPFWHVYIDYNGCVMPCCNLRSDAPAHGDAIVGDLRVTPDLAAIYAGAALARWRRHLASFAPKAGLCAHCQFAKVADTPANRAAAARVSVDVVMNEVHS